MFPQRHWIAGGRRDFLSSLAVATKALSYGQVGSLSLSDQLNRWYYYYYLYYVRWAEVFEIECHTQGINDQQTHSEDQ